MKIVFLGVGEAFDEEFSNNSHLILSDTTLLLDCGYSVPRQLWKYNADPSFVDAVYISHRHADHYFGIPPLLVRMMEEKRTKALTILCQKGLKILIKRLIELGYQGSAKKFGFKVNFIEVEEGKTLSLNELKLSFAPTIHSVNNLAIKIISAGSIEQSAKRYIVCYSGDGMFNEKTEKLYRNADLIIHEAFTFDFKINGHACMYDLIMMAKRNNIKCMAFTHIHREVRRKQMELIKQTITNEKIKIIIPEPFEEYGME